MKPIRIVAWSILLLLAGIQAWSARFYATPDGVSYLDLSDAVISGRFGELFNAYWSPLYPVLIGILRAIFRPSAYWEFGVAHLLNWFLFVASLLGYEYLLTAMRTLGEASGRPRLSTNWGTIAAYALFGVFTLMMTPLILPTPDLLVSASCFFIFGALLRLHAGADTRKAAIVLGVALAVGSLTKSFVIPWAAVCLVVAFLATRRSSYRPAIIATAIWLIAAVPWTVGLSTKTGHLTFGDTGRLTYVWYVNQVESPSRKNMPSGAATPVTDSILPGVAVTPNASGTNPIWYDPARWYSGLEPKFVAARQLEVFTMLIAEYIASLAPLFCVLCFWLIVAGRDALSEWWKRSWVVMVPAIAAICAYSLVLVTTRYVAPFYIAMTLVFVAGLRWPDRIPPWRVAVALAVPLVLMILTPRPAAAVALVNAAVGSVLFVWLARHRTPTVMVVMGIVGAASIRLFESSDNLMSVVGLSAVLVLGYWAAGRESDRRGEGELFSAITRRGLIAANAMLILLVAGLKYYDSLKQPSPIPSEANDNWFAAKQTELAHIKSGDRIALVGSPFEAYWARAARLKIVAVVPPPRQEDFNQLSRESRRRLYDEFARAGANHVIVQQQNPPEGATDRSWIPVAYIGWVRALPVR